MTGPAPGPREVTLRFLAEPGDVNFGGKVHGGAVMRWIDQAGYTCAVGWSGRYCVTAAVGGIRFVRPIRVGDLVEVHARVVHTGRTSMHVEVEVAAGDPRGGERLVTTDCVMAFVALDDAGRPTPVPPFSPASEQDRAKEADAVRRMEMQRTSGPA